MFGEIFTLKPKIENAGLKMRVAFTTPEANEYKVRYLIESQRGVIPKQKTGELYRTYSWNGWIGWQFDIRPWRYIEFFRRLTKHCPFWVKTKPSKKLV